MQAEQASIEAKNHELVEAFKEKTKSQQQTQKLYQSLKAQVMASHVAHAAGDEAKFTLQTARGDRFIDRLPGTRTGTANYSQMGLSQQMGGGRAHNRENSRSSGSSGRQQQQQGGGIHLGPPFNNSHLQGRGLGGRVHTGRKSILSFTLSCFRNYCSAGTLEQCKLTRCRISACGNASPQKSSPCAWRNTSEPVPQLRRCSFIPAVADDETASCKWCRSKRVGQLCARREDVKEVWWNSQYRFAGSLSR
jgi:hypothetical protein